MGMFAHRWICGRNGRNPRPIDRTPVGGSFLCEPDITEDSEAMLTVIELLGWGPEWRQFLMEGEER
eukprot:6462146-Alexandrium_andersonii.AAC.1